MSVFLSMCLYVVHILLLPLLLVGVIRTAKARLQNRRGPSLLQPFWDIAKMLGKGETISGTTTWVFRAAPLLNLGAVLATALMVPWLGVPSPVPGDLFLLVYLLALGKFSAGLAALDAGSPFGALGASREAAVSLQVEPTLLVGLAALAVRAHSSALPALLSPGPPGLHTAILAALVAFALWITALAELSRMPVDDPTTHLELTMIHEAQVLENSGRNLALVEYAVALKTTVIIGLVAQVVLMTLPPRPAALSYLLSLGLLLVGAGVIVVTESTLVRLRWRRVPNLLSFAAGASAIACLIVALKW